MYHNLYSVQCDHQQLNDKAFQLSLLILLQCDHQQLNHKAFQLSLLILVQCDHQQLNHKAFQLCITTYTLCNVITNLTIKLFNYVSLLILRAM